MIPQQPAIWYVYELIDPRNGQVFYVGKGKGNRINEHEAEAKTDHPSYKCNKIRSIWAAGHKVVKQKVAMFWDEEAAYQHEEDRIAEIGLDNLTNIIGGGRRKDITYSLPKRVTIKKAKVAVPMDVCWTVLRRFTGWLAFWLRRPSDKSQIIVNGKSALQGALTECFVNVILPIAWKRIIADPNNHAELQELLRPWNINLVFEPHTAQI